MHSRRSNHDAFPANSGNRTGLPRHFGAGLRLIALACGLVAATCSESPNAPHDAASAGTRILLRPHVSYSSQSAPINRIVITAREVGSSQNLGSFDRIVDSAASSWQLSFDVVLTGSAARDISLAIELMHTDAGTQSVEYSGIVVINVTPGKTAQVADVQLEPGPLAPVANLTIAPTQANLPVGTTLVLVPSALDAQGNLLSRQATWSSSDENIASVSTSGLVNARSVGSATITARVETRAAVASINVYVPAATSLEKAGGDAQAATVSTLLPTPLAVRVLDQHGNGIKGQTVQWVVTGGGGTVALATSTTDETGIAQARWTLGATAGAQKLEARVTGLAGSPVVFTATAAANTEVASITIAPTTRAMTAGDTATFIATARDAGNNTISSVTFSWSSSDTTVARVDAAGKVTALRAGSAVISAAAGSKSGTATVTVVAGAAHTLSVYSGYGQSAAAGTALRDPIVAQVSDVQGNPVAGVDVTFSVVSGGGSLSVEQVRSDSSGLVRAVWTLGPAAGLQHAQASATGLANSPVQFEASATRADGVRKTWIGGDAGNPVDWHRSANWSPIGVPGDADTVVIPVTANQPNADGGNVHAGTLIVQTGATLDNGGYSIIVSGSVDASGIIVGDGDVTMIGNNVTVRGTISNLRISGEATATGAISTSEDFLILSGNLNVNGQTITVAGDFGASGGTITMNNAADLLIVRGSTGFANIDERGKLNGGTIRAAGDFETGCYNEVEFVPAGTLVMLNGDGSSVQHIHICSSATGNRFRNLTITPGAKVTTASNPVVVENALAISGMLTVEPGALVDVMGPAGSLSLSTGAVLSNNGTVKANLPISNTGGTISGNPVVQR